MTANRLEAILPFTDWQNDLHLISRFVYRQFVRHSPDLATLITAATR